MVRVSQKGWGEALQAKGECVVRHRRGRSWGVCVSERPASWGVVTTGPGVLWRVWFIQHSGRVWGCWSRYHAVQLMSQEGAPYGVCGMGGLYFGVVVA